MPVDVSLRESYADFVRDVEPGLRRAFVSLYGPEDGREATSEALLYGWEHWPRLEGMDNPAGYLFRVGQSWARRHLRTRPWFPAVPASHEPWVEPSFPDAFRRLSSKQRTAVGLKYGADWTYDQIATLMNISLSSVRKHVERGMSKLRAAMEVPRAS